VKQIYLKHHVGEKGIEVCVWGSRSMQKRKRGRTFGKPTMKKKRPQKRGWVA